MRILPPGISNSWDTCNVQAQAELLGYENLRSYEEGQIMEMNLKAMGCQIR